MTDPMGVYADLTVGGGGHSRLIFERLRHPGTLIGCDRDVDAISQARAVLPPAVLLFQCRFSDFQSVFRREFDRPLAGVLLDLGVSSYQLDTADRGFSHRFSGPLDLRMDRTVGETAAELLARLNVQELAAMIRDYGEDPQAKRIARFIANTRKERDIKTTDDLARVIELSVPATRNKSLARVFQALRITVNNELDEIHNGLESGWNLLGTGGRLVVISYHSLEDRIVKNFMKAKVTPARDPVTLLPENRNIQGKLVHPKPVIPDADEIIRNPRARSAKLRAVEKL